MMYSLIPSFNVHNGLFVGLLGTYKRYLVSKAPQACFYFFCTGNWFSGLYIKLTNGTIRSHFKRHFVTIHFTGPQISWQVVIYFLIIPYFHKICGPALATFFVLEALFTPRSRSSAVKKTRHHAGFAFLLRTKQYRHNAATVVIQIAWKSSGSKIGVTVMT